MPVLLVGGRKLQLQSTIITVGRGALHDDMYLAEQISNEMCYMVGLTYPSQVSHAWLNVIVIWLNVIVIRLTLTSN